MNIIMIKTSINDIGRKNQQKTKQNSQQIFETLICQFMCAWKETAYIHIYIHLNWSIILFLSFNLISNTQCRWMTKYFFCQFLKAG